MGFVELLLIAVGLSMDAFAVSVCTGLTMERFKLKKALVVGLYFGVFQAVMPLIGYLAGHFFADMIVNVDHWIAFILMALIGGKMIWESLRHPECEDDACQLPPAALPEDDLQPDASGAAVAASGELIPREASLGPARMLPLAVATSIDALAVGITFSFLKVQIIPAVSLIGITTLAISMAGVKVGHTFGSRYKAKAELAGGVILVLIGLKILLEHLDLIAF